MFRGKLMKSPDSTTAVSLEEQRDVKLYSKEFIAIEASMGFMTAGSVYNAAYMSASGMSPTEVGTFMSIHSLICMVAPMFWGIMSDKYRTMKKTTLLTTLLAVLVYAPMPLYAMISLGSISLAPIMILISAFLIGSSGQLLTSWVMQSKKEHSAINFGVIRLFWSMFYAVACFGYATLMGRFSGISMYTVSFTGFGISGIITILFILKGHDFTAGNTQKQSFRDMPIGTVIKHPRILVYIVFSIFITIPTLGLNNFLQYLIADVNGNKSILGYMVGIRSLCAIPFMFLSSTIHRKIGTRNALRISAVAYGIAQVLFFFCQNTTQILAVCICQGMAFGLLIPTQVLYINQYAPVSLIATTQTMVTVANMLSQSIFSTVGGIVIDVLHIRAFYLLSALACGLAFIVFTFGNKYLDKVRGKD